MNTKTLIAGVLTAIVTFFIGWLIFGMLLMDYYNHHMLVYTGLMKNPPNLVYIAGSNLAWGLMLAYVYSLAGINQVAKGFLTGLIIFGLIAAGIDAMFHAQFNLYSRKVLIIDVAANAVLGGIAGALLGWWNGRK
jgi:hypothetical protein